MADIFDVIADPTRRDLLLALLERPGASAIEPGELSVGGLVERLGVSQPTVSKHLKVLRDSSLVRVREDGQHRYYSLDAAPLEDVEAWLVTMIGTKESTRDAGSDHASPDDRSDEIVDESVVDSDGVIAARTAGAAVGRVVAAASFGARAATENARHRIIRPIRRALGQDRSRQ